MSRNNTYFWVPEVNFSDPQGNENIEDRYQQAIEFLDPSGETVFYQPLYCAEDGSCRTNWSEFDKDVYCTGSAGYTVRYQLRDLDGHLSEPFDIVLSDQVPDLHGR